MTPVLPGATIGIFGGGQLGRMMTLAARVLGYHVIILDPDPNCAAGAVADRVIAAKFDDVAAATELARACDVITVEIEKIGAEAMAAASAIVPVRPGGHVLYIIQDRARQKRWLDERDFPLGPFWVARRARSSSASRMEERGRARVREVVVRWLRWTRPGAHCLRAMTRTRCGARSAHPLA